MLFNYCINLLRFRNTVLKKKPFLISVFFLYYILTGHQGFSMVSTPKVLVKRYPIYVKTILPEKKNNLSPDKIL